jgi:serine/threonine-protein kinase
VDPAALQILHGLLERRRRGVPEVVDMPGADLRGAHLLRADLVGADLSGAGLDHAALAGAKLGRADLGRASLIGANLSGADLTSANLSGADLSDACLEGACFADADLRGADLSGVTGEPASVVGARIDALACVRSELEPAEILVLWYAGAELEDLGKMPEEVRRTCLAAKSEEEARSSDHGPAARQLDSLELQSRRRRLEEDDAQPPSSRFDGDLGRMTTPTPGDSAPPPLSTRSLGLIRSIPPPASGGPGWRPGDRLMGVELERILGEGNAGVVWLGRDDSGARTCVKLFDLRRLGLGLSLAAFRRGVQVMNRLTAREDRPRHVAPLGAVSLNRLAFTTPFAENGSVVDLPALRWPVEKLVAFFERVCRAAAAAHEIGVLHRCLKPSNVLLDGELEPVVTDFDVVDLQTVAATGPDAGGYAAYAAPEELLGTGTQSPTADVYSLGRLLAFLLLGDHPGEPAARVPELASLRGQPVGLVRIVRKCTMLAPEARYQWVSELCDDLARYGESDEVGVACAADEVVALPQRLSALPQRQPWVAGKARRRQAPQTEAARAVTDAVAAMVAEERTRKEQRAARARVHWPGRGFEHGVAAAGAALALLGLLSIAQHQVPPAGLVDRAAWAVAVGSGAATLWLPRFEHRLALARAALAIAVIVAVRAMGLGPLVRERLERTLQAGPADARAGAVRALVRIGRRHFDGVDLSGLDLSGADLSQASLRGSTLRAANLEGAALMESDLDGADLASARAAGADLSGSNAPAARGWESVRCDGATRMPDGWRCRRGRPTPADR